MIYNVSNLNASKIVIGRRGENLATTIEIDVSAWLAEWPSAGITVVVMRPGDTAPYVAGTSVSNNGVLSWPVTDVDTANAGKGKIEVRASSGAVMKKSVIATIEVEPCILCDEDADPPELDPALVDQAIAAAERAEKAVQRVEDGFDWSEVENKPETFPPSTHSHKQSDIIGLENALSGKAESNHTHKHTEITGLESALSQRDRVQNLLVNSYFPSAHVINQRGKTTYTGNAYSIDMWRAYHATTTHTVTAAGIAVSATDNNPNLYQVLDASKIDDTKTYTAAVCDSDGNVFVWSGKLSTAASGTVCIYRSGSSLLFRVVGVKTWRWAALYEGEYTIDTLPTYIPKENEMLACRHCAITLGGVFRYRAVQISGSIIDFSIPLPVLMRARPSFDTSALTVYSFPEMNAQSDFTFAIVQETTNGILIRATKSGHGLSDGVLGIATNTLFSADR